MKYAYFDCFSGISGDMILGALLHAGVPLEELRSGLASLKLEGYTIDSMPLERGGICGVHCLVKTEHHHHHRHLPDIQKIINESGVSETVKHKAKMVFKRLAEAEGKVHGIAPEKVHFHEVGATDAIVDVVGANIGFEILGIDRIFSSPLAFGTGTVHAAHGEIPVPVPATVELAKDYPVRQTSIPMELTTPTGAAILTTLSEGTQLPAGLVLKVSGYGAGSRETSGMPNFLRLLVLEGSAPVDSDRIIVLEANLDDMNPEIYPFFMEKLFEAGALDVFLTSVIMKKGRPGTKISVLSPETDVEKLMPVFFAESTTIGVRMALWDRKKLPRDIIEIKTSRGQVKFKSVIFNGRKHIIPEFEECRRIALNSGASLKETYAQMQRIADDYSNETE